MSKRTLLSSSGKIQAITGAFKLRTTAGLSLILLLLHLFVSVLLSRDGDNDAYPLLDAFILSVFKWAAYTGRKKTSLFFSFFSAAVFAVVFRCIT